MTSPNDSVIICDSPSPTKSTNEWMNTLTNYRKRLRSCRDFKALLDTVYESPLVHLKRNIVPNSDSDISVVTTPPSKRQKIGAKATKIKKTLDQSVVVINDIAAEPVVEIGLSDAETNDVVEVPETRRKNLTPKLKILRKKSKITAARTRSDKFGAKRPNSRTPGKRENREKNLRKSVVCLSVNDENRNGQIMEKSSSSTGDAEDIEVVWVSDTNIESTSRQQQQPQETQEQPQKQQQQQQQQQQQKRTANAEHPFVIDTVPTPQNLAQLLETVRQRRRHAKRLQPKVKKSKAQKTNKSWKNINSEENDRPIQPSGERIIQNNKNLREIVIDGCNVAMGHKHGTAFSEKGLQIVIDHFKERGHVVTAFLPQNTRSRDRLLLEKLHTSGHVVFTPSRVIGGKKITPYDDRFILEYATKCNGIVVSSDQYRDLWREKPQWRDTIENRLLTPTFVGDYLMFPEDPLGRSGPKLEEFLRY